MKRYILSIFAVIIAVGMAAFTAPENDNKAVANYSFYYMAPGGTDFSQPAVQNKNNWKSAPSPLPTCTGSNKACRIDIVDTYTELDGTGKRVFKTSGSSIVDIVAEEGSTEELYVPIVASSTGLHSKIDRQ